MFDRFLWRSGGSNYQIFIKKAFFIDIIDNLNVISSVSKFQ